MSAFEKGYEVIWGALSVPFLNQIEARLEEDPRGCLDLVMQHPTVEMIARGLVGEELGRTGEENVNVNPVGQLYDAWHYDIPWDSLDGGVIPVWRFAVYFRDYMNHSGGLAVSPYSHLGTVLSQPRTCHVVQSRPGDLVIWNLRTYHKGGAHNGVLPVASPRNAIFFDYGTPGIELKRYVDWRKERKAK